MVLSIVLTSNWVRFCSDPRFELPESGTPNVKKSLTTGGTDKKNFWLIELDQTGAGPLVTLIGVTTPLTTTVETMPTPEVTSTTSEGPMTTSEEPTTTSEEPTMTSESLITPEPTTISETMTQEVENLASNTDKKLEDKKFNWKFCKEIDLKIDFPQELMLLSSRAGFIAAVLVFIFCCYVYVKCKENK